jgi:hypothetical protein
MLGVVRESLLRASSRVELARFRASAGLVTQIRQISLSDERATADKTCTRDREGGITIGSSRFRIEVMV